MFKSCEHILEKRIVYSRKQWLTLWEQHCIKAIDYFTNQYQIINIDNNDGYEFDPNFLRQPSFDEYEKIVTEYRFRVY